jgi:N,N'-diacetyllegionaminate synthase
VSIKHKTFIIAEAGVNHNGSLDLAKNMIEAAASAGADAVKFQTFNAENLVCGDTLKAAYQKSVTDANETQFDMLRRLELDKEAHEILFNYCKEIGIQFISSPFDIEGIDLLCSLGVDIIKIPSGEITNLPYLRKIGMLGKEVILSAGMSTLGEIGEALDVIVNSGTQLCKITVLHCNTEYPTSMEDVNLLAMQTIAQTFKVKTGYSDHTLGIEVPVAAVALGASIIEKHFTLDRNLPGPDHKASMVPDELVEMVKCIRNVEIALGSRIKKPSPSELRNINIVRKSIVAGKSIRKGEIFTETNLTVKRPGSGISPMLWDDVIGNRAVRDYQPDELI